MPAPRLRPVKAQMNHLVKQRRSRPPVPVPGKRRHLLVIQVIYLRLKAEQNIPTSREEVPERRLGTLSPAMILGALGFRPDFFGPEKAQFLDQTSIAFCFSNNPTDAGIMQSKEIANLFHAVSPACIG